MNTYLRKINKNTKALSPVIASIILIAVTVAVSVVVAAWMGGMSIGLMGNAEQVSIANVEFTNATTAILTVQNSAGADSTVTAAYIDGVSAGTIPATVIPKNGIATVSVTGDFSAGQAYQFKLLTTKGTSVVQTATYNP